MASNRPWGTCFVSYPKVGGGDCITPSLAWQSWHLTQSLHMASAQTVSTKLMQITSLSKAGREFPPENRSCYLLLGM